MGGLSRRKGSGRREDLILLPVAARNGSVCNRGFFLAQLKPFKVAGLFLEIALLVAFFPWVIYYTGGI
jgi:hypothetical protein